jgi:D-alanyl-lipoteichoic acid acyltransferase DltB (MBOAT superfamily)
MVLALAVYYLLSRRLQNIWLLILSYGFVVSWDWKFALVLGFATMVNFFLAQELVVNDQSRRTRLWVGIGFNVLILVLFRSLHFFLPALESSLGRLGIPAQNGLTILVPLGLSYYALQNISYLVDVSRGQLKAETDWVDFALYLAYFPKLVAGPIERARSFLPKLAQPRVVDNDILTRSFALIIVGTVRKLLTADLLMPLFLDDVFQLPAKYTPTELLMWLLIYAVAIYNDFAGYTNLVRGVSGLFGIELSPNFRTPYFSRSFTEFWQRWHISLSEWLRDYIYFPLSRALIRRNPSHNNLANLILPPLVTMLVSGLWHGFSVNMLLWGGLHGVYQIVERVIGLRRQNTPEQTQPLWRQGLAMAVVFGFVILAWVPFRWGIPATFSFWGALLNFSGLVMRYRRLIFVIPILLGSLGLDFLQYRTEDEFIFLKWPRLVQATCVALILLLIFITTSAEFKEPFVYQAF